MIALGWAGAGALPDGLSWVAAGPLRLVTIAEAQARSARRRSEWQVACIEGGLDLLPLAPSHAVPVTEALQMPVSALRTRFEAVAGLVQITVSTVLPKLVGPKFGGRSWLKERAKAEDARQNCADTLLHCARATGHPVTPTRLVGQSVACDILVPRAAVAEVADRLQRAFDAGERAPMPLTVCGPWPAYSFANLPELEPA